MSIFPPDVIERSPLTISAPPLSCTIAPAATVTLWTNVAAVVRGKYGVAYGMTTSGVGPGTTPTSQFPALLQSPVDAPFAPVNVGTFVQPWTAPPLVRTTHPPVNPGVTPVIVSVSGP